MSSLTRSPRAAAALAALVLSLAAAPRAAAHFLLNANIRAVHVEALPDGYRVYLRVPFPMVVVSPEIARNVSNPDLVAPFTYNRTVDNQLMHYADPTGVRADPMRLGRMVADGHRFTVRGRTLEGRVEAVALQMRGRLPLFNTLAAAKAALESPVYPDTTDPVFAGDLLVDVRIFYPYAGPKDVFELSSTLAPGLPGEQFTENMLLYERPDGTVAVRVAQGVLATPLRVDASLPTAVASFVRDGAGRVLRVDQILFVLCLALGAVTLGALAERWAAFAAALTLTLVAGFLGYTPRVLWFIPAVEAGVALSIVCMGLAALLFRGSRANAPLAAALGLVHGFAVALALSGLLKRDSPHLLASFVSFDIGLLFGQAAVIALVLVPLRSLDRGAPHLSRYARATAACGAIAMAAVWAGSRSLAILQAI